jgi:hypothetical protein
MKGETLRLFGWIFKAFLSVSSEISESSAAKGDFFPLVLVNPYS